MSYPGPIQEQIDTFVESMNVWLSDPERSSKLMEVEKYLTTACEKDSMTGNGASISLGSEQLRVLHASVSLALGLILTADDISKWKVGQQPKFSMN